MTNFTPRPALGAFSSSREGRLSFFVAKRAQLTTEHAESVSALLQQGGPFVSESAEEKEIDAILRRDEPRQQSAILPQVTFFPPKVSQLISSFADYKSEGIDPRDTSPEETTPIPTILPTNKIHLL